MYRLRWLTACYVCENCSCSFALDGYFYHSYHYTVSQKSVAFLLVLTIIHPPILSLLLFKMVRLRLSATYCMYFYFSDHTFVSTKKLSTFACDSRVVLFRKPRLSLKNSQLVGASA